MQPEEKRQANKHIIRPEDIGFGLLFWAARDAVIVGDLDSGRVVLWNPSAEHLFGYTAEEATGMPIEAFFPECFRDIHRATLTDRRATGLSAGDVKPREVSTSHKSGQEIVIEFTMSTLEAHGQAYLFALVRDCTERKCAEREREALLSTAHDYANRMGELATMKSDFTAMVAHELDTPISAIRALVDLLGREELSTTQRQHILETMRAEAHLLQRLVKDMHTTATIERDDFVIRPQPTAVAMLLAEAAASVQVLLAEHPFHVEPAPFARVMADAARIGQVLRNLLGNVAKHTPPGTPVELLAREERGRVYIEVADRGPGIQPNDLSRVFAKFGRGSDAEGRRIPGAGLGLYLSRRIIQAHGSDLHVESTPGEGTTFSFTLEREH